MIKLGKKIILFLMVAVFGLSIASCKDEDNTPKYTGTAEDLLNLVILEQDGNAKISGDFTVPASVVDAETGLKFAVTWSSNNENVLKFESNVDVEYMTAKVTRPSGEDAKVEYTASLTANNQTATKTFKIVVTALNYSSIEQLWTSAEESVHDIQGIIVSKSDYFGGKTNLYIANMEQTAAFYVYNYQCTETDYNALARGQVVLASGTKQMAFGAAQLVNASIVKQNKTETVKVTNITSDVSAGKYVELNFTDADPKTAYNKAVDGHLFELVSISNATVTETSAPNPGSLKMKFAVNGKTIPLYLSTSAGYTEDSEIYKAYAALAIGDEISATFVMNSRDNKCQLTATELVDELKVPQSKKIAQEELNKAVESVTLESIITNENKPTSIVKLYNTTVDGVTLTYTLDAQMQEYFDLSETNELTLTGELPQSATEVSMTIESKYDKDGDTATLNETIEFVLAASLNDWEKFYYAPTGTTGLKYEGIVTMYSQSKGAALVQNGSNAVYVNLYGIDQVLTVGTQVKLTGYKGVYNDYQFCPNKESGIQVVEKTLTDPTYLDISEIVASGEDLTKYQGMLVEVKNATYDGSKLVLGENSVNWYVDSKILSGSLENTLVAGGVYNIKGFINCYKSNQITPIAADAVEVVSEPVSGADATVKATVEKDGNLTDGENIASLLNLDSKLFEAYVDKGSKSNSVYAKTTGEFRLYANAADQNGNSLTIKALSNKIAKIVIDAKGDNGDTLFTVSGIEGNQTIVKSGAKLTLEFASEGVSEFTIKNINSENIKLIINSIEIYFA